MHLLTVPMWKQSCFPLWQTWSCIRTALQLACRQTTLSRSTQSRPWKDQRPGFLYIGLKFQASLLYSGGISQCQKQTILPSLVNRCSNNWINLIKSYKTHTLCDCFNFLLHRTLKRQIFHQKQGVIMIPFPVYLANQWTKVKSWWTLKQTKVALPVQVFSS